MRRRYPKGTSRGGEFAPTFGSSPNRRSSLFRPSPFGGVFAGDGISPQGAARMRATGELPLLGPMPRGGFKGPRLTGRVNLDKALSIPRRRRLSLRRR